MEIYSLSGLNLLIGKALKQAFPELVWLEAEISRITERSGHFYIELVEKSGSDILAKSSAVIWRNTSYIIRQKLRNKFDDLIQPGIHVKILVSVDYHPVYGHKLIIHDLDPEFTMGQMELMRTRILQRLKDEKLLDKNKLTALPLALKNIAVISSETAAGYQDFIKQLTHNRFGYTFNISLFNASMQGANLEQEVVAALRNIQAQGKWDVVCIVRGGGSRVDLAWFDNYEVAREIANSVIPVITGIGHEIDKSVADFVAHSSVKTPTATAEFIVQYNHRFEETINNLVFDISQISLNFLENKEKTLANSGQLLYLYSKGLLDQQASKLLLLESEVKNSVLLALDRHRVNLEKMEQFLEIASPENILKKGYAIVRQGDKVIRRAEEINKEELVHIQFYDSEIKLKP